jgi:hypothetical protein
MQPFDAIQLLDPNAIQLSSLSLVRDSISVSEQQQKSEHVITAADLCGKILCFLFHLKWSGKRERERERDS